MSEGEAGSTPREPQDDQQVAMLKRLLHEARAEVEDLKAKLNNDRVVIYHSVGEAFESTKRAEAAEAACSALRMALEQQTARYTNWLEPGCSCLRCDVLLEVTRDLRALLASQPGPAQETP